MDVDALIRRRLLQQMFDKMSDTEKASFAMLMKQERDHSEVMEALRGQQQQLAAIGRKQNWLVDFGSDVAANLFTDSLIWIGAKLLRKI